MAKKHTAKYYIKSIEMVEEDVKYWTSSEFPGHTKFSKEETENIAKIHIKKVGYSVLQELLDRYTPRGDKSVPFKNPNLPGNIFEIENYDGRVYVTGYDIQYEESKPIAIDYFEKTDIPNLELRLKGELSSEDTKR